MSAATEVGAVRCNPGTKYRGMERFADWDCPSSLLDTYTMGLWIHTPWTCATRDVTRCSRTNRLTCGTSCLRVRSARRERRDGGRCCGRRAGCSVVFVSSLGNFWLATNARSRCIISTHPFVAGQEDVGAFPGGTFGPSRFATDYVFVRMHAVRSVR